MKFPYRLFPISILHLLASFAFSVSTHARERPPNLVIIFADDLGYGDLECYGHPTIRTPHLNRMAAEGTRFTQFYVAASVCTPSRAGLLTGRYPVRTGMVKGLIPGRVLFPNDKVGLPQREVTIAEVLKQKNYATAAVGKWHLGHLPEFLPTAQGFDSYYGIPYSNDMDHVGARDGQPAYWNVPLLRDTSIIERPADQTTLTKRYTEEAVRFIHENAERPFFLYLAHTMPHVPLFASPDFAGASARGLYGDVVEEIDWSVGRVLEALEEAGIGKNTLVIFTSDNGPWLSQGANGGSAGLLKEGKGMTWEGGMRVPMIAWWPGAVPAGKTSHALATTLDLLPTAAALAGTMPPELLLDGYNILPVLKGAAPSPRDFFLYYRNDRIYAARYGPWKAHFFTQSEYPAGPLAAHEPPLLFHLENDPSERFNLAAGHPEVIEQIRKRVDAHRKTVKDANQPSIEAEAMIDQARVTGGALRVQPMAPFAGFWSGDAQLWWVGASPGDRLVLPLEAAEAGTYELVGFFTRAQDYGIVRLLVNGRPVGALMDGYAQGVEHTGPVSFGPVELQAGENELAVELVGKDVRSGGYSDGYLVGIDGFLLR
ncbi:MAG: sulfatase-like hydrolase/transferase [Phaeodactylibacter sp.]|nr:sulfatase-like hydrolase/transferase [Phaeodactylibacter sp.]